MSHPPPVGAVAPGQPPDGAAAAAASSDAATVLGLIGEESPLQKHIKKLREEKNALRKENQQIARQLRNAEKKRMRLRHKARQLSKEDLISVLQMRAANSRSDAAEASTPAVASASGSASSAHGAPPAPPA